MHDCCAKAITCKLRLTVIKRHVPRFALPVGLDSAKEELGTVCVRTSVGHRKYAGAFVLELAVQSTIRNVTAELFARYAHIARKKQNSEAYKFSSSNLLP